MHYHQESESLLSSPPSTFDIANLLEQIFMDINTFSETSIALYDTHLDLFLLPFYANPPEIRLWDVPIAVTGLEEMKNASWDVTLFKVCRLCLPNLVRDGADLFYIRSAHLLTESTT